MKYFLTGTFLLFFINSLCQELIIDDSVVFKRGIYKTFEEFKYNNPSLPLLYEVIADTTLPNIFRDDRKPVSYLLRIDNQQGKEIGEIFGFCDGKNIFINSYIPKLKKNTEFAVIEFLGFYSYFKEFDIQYSGGRGPGGVPAGGSAKVLVEKTLCINHGEVEKLFLRKILTDDDDLLHKFLKDDKKHIDVIKYLKEYSAGHKSYIVRVWQPKMTMEEANLLLNKTESDTTYKAYYQRIYWGLKSNSALKNVTLNKAFYKTGQIKSIGITLNNNYNGNIGFTYKVGVWMNFSNNGSVISEDFYNIIGRK